MNRSVHILFNFDCRVLFVSPFNLNKNAPHHLGLGVSLLSMLAAAAGHSKKRKHSPGEALEPWTDRLRHHYQEPLLFNCTKYESLVVS